MHNKFKRTSRLLESKLTVFGRNRNADYVKFRRNPSLGVIDISAWNNKLF